MNTTEAASQPTEPKAAPTQTDEPILYMISYRGAKTSNVYDTREGAEQGMDRLNAAHPEEVRREIVPLYDHPVTDEVRLTSMAHRACLGYEEFYALFEDAGIDIHSLVSLPGGPKLLANLGTLVVKTQVKTFEKLLGKEA